jgi:hypothetical protein
VTCLHHKVLEISTLATGTIQAFRTHISFFRDLVHHLPEEKRAEIHGRLDASQRDADNFLTELSHLLSRSANAFTPPSPPSS